MTLTMVLFKKDPSLWLTEVTIVVVIGGGSASVSVIVAKNTAGNVDSAVETLCDGDCSVV